MPRIGGGNIGGSGGGSTTAVPTGITGIIDYTGLLGPISKPPPRQTPTMITTFQAGHGWSVTGTGATSNANDTTDFVLGSQAIRGTSNGAGATTNIRRAAAPNADLTTKSVRLLIKVDNLANLNSLSLYMGSAAFANFYLVPIYNPGDGKTLREGEWTWLEVNFNGASAATLTGTPSKATITDWQLQWTDTGGVPVTVHCNAIGIVNDPAAFPNGVVSITFDDTWVNQYTNAMPILDRYGFPASAMTIADQVGVDAAHMTLAQLRAMHDLHGWEVAGHAYSAAGHNTTFTALSATDLDNELRALKTWLVANGFGQYDYLAYPLGNTNPAVEQTVRKYFSASRTIVPAPAQVLPMVFPNRLRSKSLANTTTTAQIQTLVDNAYNNKNWLILTFHNVLPTATLSTDYSVANFTTITDYLNTRGIPIRTVGEVMRAA
jgi:peptidoglycan/xylan/chitin deacetylase (PgdA/CDA1 family)